MKTKYNDLEKKNGMLPLNIQLFADDGGDGGDGGNGGGEPAPKTYSEEEYSKLKLRIEELNKNEKSYKEQLKAKLTDEEKLAQSQKEKDEAYANLQKENQTMKMAKELAVGGFGEKDIETLSNAILGNDYNALCKAMVEIRKTMTDEITKQAKIEFQKTNKLPNGGSNDDELSIGAKLGKERSNKNSVREYYNKK